MQRTNVQYWSRFPPPPLMDATLGSTAPFCAALPPLFTSPPLACRGKQSAAAPCWTDSGKQAWQLRWPVDLTLSAPQQRLLDPLAMASGSLFQPLHPTALVPLHPFRSLSFFRGRFMRLSVSRPLPLVALSLPGGINLPGLFRACARRLQIKK